MNIFTLPKSIYESQIDQERFKLTWRVFIILLAVFSFLVIFHIFYSQENLSVAVGAFIVAISGLAFLKFSKSFVITALITGIGGSLINQYDLFFIVGSAKFITLLWIVGITLFVFYMIGSLWGFLTFLINLTGISIAFFIIPPEIQISALINRTPASTFSIIVNLVLIVFVITYLMHQILRTSKVALAESEKSREELKNQYTIVQDQNEEKTILLKEVHHRVKNNLQVITSLLRLQSADIDDEKTISLFREAMNRVVAMALIHDKMYQSDDLSKINLEDYLTTLLDDLVLSYAIDIPIKTSIDSELTELDNQSLVPLALIFNELVTNSLKHGFKGKGSGEISIKYSKSSEGVHLTYKDNGKWIESEKENSFGLELIDSLVQQLDGTFELNISKGTEYRFVFP